MLLFNHHNLEPYHIEVSKKSQYWLQNKKKKNNNNNNKNKKQKKIKQQTKQLQTKHTADRGRPQFVTDNFNKIHCNANSFLTLSMMKYFFKRKCSRNLCKLK